MGAPGPTITGAGGKPLGYQQISAATLAAATGLTVPAGATVAVVIDEVASTAVRWRDDGTAPTGAVGMYLPSGTYINFSGDLSVIKFILATGGSPILNVAYY